MPRAVYAASVISLALGLFFVFVWAPHPWGWAGIDHYYELGHTLARGEPFPTTDVPWGYAYYLAFFYRFFGDQLWIPLMVQVAANALIPILLYHVARRFVDHSTAALAALLTGVLSFNTVYASTQSSDSICTVLFMAGLLCLTRAPETGRFRDFAAAGLLAGLVPQFRPNMLLLPGVLALFYVAARPRSVLKFRQAAVFLGVMCLVLTPWIVRNYRLTATFMPSSSHGGTQLWYGTLQTGPYLKSRAYNPRSILESSPFYYTSIANLPIVISATQVPCPGSADTPPRLTYWTDRDRAPKEVSAVGGSDQRLSFTLPGQPAPTAVYYFIGTADVPQVFFVSEAHLEDMDTHGDLLDIFDLVRLLRHLAWNEPLPFANRLDFDGDGRSTESDFRRAATLLLQSRYEDTQSDPVRAVRLQPEDAVAEFADGSRLTVPRAFSGRLTDVEFEGRLAGELEGASRMLAGLQAPAGQRGSCQDVELAVNEVFYRKEPHMSRRYVALAIDNIKRAPGAYAQAVAYRMVRLFIVAGDDDRQTTQQFAAGRLVYPAALWVSLAYFVLFVAGAAVAWRQHPSSRVLLIPIVYIPLTISFVLTNMRYTVTVQPLVFVFVAVALVTIYRSSAAE